MWSTFSKADSTQTQKTLVPGEFGVVSTIDIPNTAEGIEIIAEDTVNTTRFINLSVENKADSNGDPISVYVGVGITPTPTSYSFELLSGQQEYAMLVNGQQVKAISESGQTIKMNIQLANAISKIL